MDSVGAPALADEVTARLHALSVRQAQVYALVMTAALAYLVALVSADVEPWIMMMALGVVFGGVTTLGPARDGLTWRPATGRLLAARPWRETPDGAEHAAHRVPPARR
jgi:hypothetical protein